MKMGFVESNQIKSSYLNLCIKSIMLCENVILVISEIHVHSHYGLAILCCQSLILSWVAWLFIKEILYKNHNDL